MPRIPLFPRRTILSSYKQTRKFGRRTGFKIEYRLVVFTPYALGTEAVQRLGVALEHEIPESFHQLKRGFIFKIGKEKHEVVSPTERSLPWWRVRIEREIVRDDEVELVKLREENIRPRQSKQVSRVSIARRIVQAVSRAFFA